MSNPKYLKCACRHCRGTIEFPAHGIGRSIPCPHCGNKTSLYAPATDPIEPAPASAEDQPPPSAPSDLGHEATAAGPGPVRSVEAEAATQSRSASRRAFSLGLIVLVALCVAGSALGFRWFRRQSPPSPASGSPSAAPATGGTTSSPVPPSPSPNPLPAAGVIAPKSAADLQAGAVRLEKAPGSSLVYAVGTLTNASPHQRFGVRIEVALNDRNGRSAGTAKDYRAVLEPRQEWTFRALALDTKAATARVAAISEDE